MTENYRYKEVSNDVSDRLAVVGQLASGIAHEINTPVQYINDNLRYVSKELDSVIRIIRQYQSISKVIVEDSVLSARFAQIQSLGEIDDIDHLADELPMAIEESLFGVESISSIVKSMKSIVHAGSAEKVVTDVNTAIRNAITVSRGSWKELLDLREELDEELPSVLCYDGELGQVLINLILNGAHAVEDTGKRGTLTIRSFVYKDSIGIQIEDSGTGIPLEIQHRIFDPFFSSKEVGRGTGQGLAFAHSSIVERSGGTLFFETSEGAGTTFHIYLPLSPKGEST